MPEISSCSFWMKKFLSLLYDLVHINVTQATKNRLQQYILPVQETNENFTSWGIMLPTTVSISLFLLQFYILINVVCQV